MSALYSRQQVYAVSIAQLQHTLAATPLALEPFPHIVIRQFFPAHIYERLLEMLPETELYQRYVYLKNAAPDGSSKRNHFQMTDDALELLAPAEREFWLGVRDVLGCVAFKNAMFQKLAPGLALRFGVGEEEAAKTPGFPLPELFRETSGYAIKPHPDTRKKLVTMQIALPQGCEKAHLGTEFYKRSLSPLSLLREPRGFDIETTMPFLPNTAYAFSVLNSWRLKSWHGRTTLPHGAGQRDSILNIWYVDASLGNPDIVREHYTQQKTTLRRVA